MQQQAAEWFTHIPLSFLYSSHLIKSICLGLGKLEDALGMYTEAMVHFKQCLQIREEELGPNHKDVAATYMK